MSFCDHIWNQTEIRGMHCSKCDVGFIRPRNNSEIIRDQNTELENLREALKRLEAENEHRKKYDALAKALEVDR